jgi:enoyl-CoA hydratase
LAFEVRLEQRGALATITVDHPPVNALHPDVSAAIHQRVEEIAANRELRAVVLTGAGAHFMAGGDINYLETLDRGQAERYVLGIQAMQDALAQLPQPVVAAINGTCLGGGCELAMACDIRVADERSIFGQPEVSLGIIPGAGGTQQLPRLVSVGRAKRLLFTADRIDAREALAIGLVDEVVAAGEALTSATALAARIARNAPLAVATAKRAVNLGLQMGILEAHRLEATLFAGLVETEDFAEGIRAFLAKRSPEFHRS